MARKPTKQNIEKNIELGPVNEISVGSSSEYIDLLSRDYAQATLRRAIPDMRDGLKDSQRRVFYVMNKTAMNGADRKVVTIAGDLISIAGYLHGDASGAGTVIGLASPVSSPVPLLGHRGNFGTVVDRNAASPRYTYANVTKVTKDLVFTDIEIVEMQPQYDGNNQEPINFLPLIPLSLVCGQLGIAVGYKTNILPYKLSHIIKNCINVIKGTKQKEMLPYYEFMGCNPKVTSEGEEKFVVYGKGEVIDGSTVKITGLPPNTDLDKFTERLISMYERGLIRDYDDDSSKSINITVKLPRGTSSNWTEDDILKYFDLQNVITQSLVLLQPDGTVKKYNNTQEVISDFVAYRFKFYSKRYTKLRDDAKIVLCTKNLVKSCFDNGITDKLKSMKNKADVLTFVNDINKNIGASDESVQNIINYAIHRWTNESYQSVIEEIKSLEAEIAGYDDIINSPDKQKEIYISELQNLIKYDT